MNFSMKKRGQEIFGMSFGVIFGIILVVVFIVLAIIIINHFLNFDRCAKIGLFIQDFEDNADSVYKSSKASIIFESTLPADVEFACFANLSAKSYGAHKDKTNRVSVYGNKNNFFFWPLAQCNMNAKQIAHLDLNELIEKDNPYCFSAKGKVRIKLEKDFNDKNVRVLPV